jgi:homospermidine synthase
MEILMIGCGGVGRTLLELWALEKIKIDKLVVIEPQEIPQWCFEMFVHLHHIKKALSKTNLKKVLTPLLKDKPEGRDAKPFVVDVSVDVDAIKVMELCKMSKCHYINTSVEGWEESHPEILKTTKQALIKRSLQSREEQAEKIVGNVKTTILTNMGMNPGGISCLALRGLNDYTHTYGDAKAKQLLKAKEWAKLAHHLQLQEIQVSELDTQKLNKPRPNDAFFNTWSPTGFQAEALDPIQIGNGSNRKDDKGGVVKGNMRIYPVRGMDYTCSSVVVGLDGKPIEINGLMIPHAEADTLSSFLTDGDYRPSVFYVYECSDVGKESLDYLRKRKYIPVPLEKCYVVQSEDITSGYDSVGALLIFPDCAWWCGSILDISETRKLGFKHAGPTTVQVATFINTAIHWINKNRKEGFVEPENLDWQYVIGKSKKYLGKIFSKEL